MRTLYNFTISMNVRDLISKLTANKAQHKEDYDLACKQYRSEMIEMLKERIKEIVQDELVPQKYAEFNVPCPISYAHVYDQILKMLEMTDAESVQITSDQFSAWVEDKWDWSDAFNENTISYAMKMKVR
jgi:hypothetical protein